MQDPSPSNPSNETRRAELQKIYRTQTAVAPPKAIVPKAATATLLVFSAEDLGAASLPPAASTGKGFGRPVKAKLTPNPPPAAEPAAAKLTPNPPPAAEPAAAKSTPLSPSNQPVPMKGSTKGHRLDFDCTEKRVALVPLELQTSMLGAITTPETAAAVFMSSAPPAPTKPPRAKRTAEVLAAEPAAAGPKRARVEPVAAGAKRGRPGTPVPVLERTDSASQMVMVPAAARSGSLQMARSGSGSLQMARSGSRSSSGSGSGSGSRARRSRNPSPAQMAGAAAMVRRIASAPRHGFIPASMHPLAQTAWALMFDPAYGGRPYSSGSDPSRSSGEEEFEEEIVQARGSAGGTGSEVFDAEYDPESPAYDSPVASAPEGGSVATTLVASSANWTPPSRSAGNSESGASSGTAVWSSSDPVFSAGNTDLDSTPSRDDGLGSPSASLPSSAQASQEETQLAGGVTQPAPVAAAPANPTPVQQRVTFAEEETQPGGAAEEDDGPVEKLDHGEVTPTTAYIQSFLRRANSRQGQGRFSPEVTVDWPAERAKAAAGPAAAADARQAEDAASSASFLGNYATCVDDELRDLIGGVAAASASIDVAKEEFEGLRTLMAEASGGSAKMIPRKRLAMAVESVKLGRTAIKSLRRSVRGAKLGANAASIALETVEERLKTLLERACGAAGRDVVPDSEEEMQDDA